MKNIQYAKFTLSIVVVLLICACAEKKVLIKGTQYDVFNPDSVLHRQYTKGYIGDYSDMIVGRAYKGSSVNFLWLDPDVKFSKYQRLTIVNLDNWSGKKVFKYENDNAEYDISETVTGAFAMEPRLRKNFKAIARGKEEDTGEGLIIKGVVTNVVDGLLTVTVETELLLIDANTKKIIGKIILSGSNVGFQFAAERIPTMVGDLIESYWDESPDFDPRDILGLAPKKREVSEESQNQEKAPAHASQGQKRTESVPATIQATQPQETSTLAPQQVQKNKEAKYLVVASTKANLRQSPTKDGKIIKQMTKGDQVELVKEKGDWYLIETSEGMTGWANKMLFK